MKLKKMLKTFLSDTKIVLADIDEPANVNGYSKFFPTVFRGIKTHGIALELRREVNSWRYDYEVVLVGITDRIDEQGKDKYVVLYFRIER